MRVLVLTAGSRGDVQPFVALGTGLKAAGHEVTVCTHSTFEGFVTERGLGYAYLNDELVRFLGTDEGRSTVEKAHNIIGWLGKAVSLRKVFTPMMRRMLDEEWKAARGAEAVVYHPKAAGGFHIAERLGVPGFMAMPLPMMTPTRAFPMILFPDLKIGGWYNRLTYSALPLITLMYRKVIDGWREEVLGLPRRGPRAGPLVRGDGTPVPTMYCYSPHVLPRPDDWPGTTAVTGYWFLDSPSGWEPPVALEEFLTAGSPPVYVGFGSIAGRAPRRLAGTVLEAIGRTGQRGLIASGWGGLEASSLPENVYRIDSVPHDWLLPRVSAVVHHGGAGTTAAGLRAGRPTVICPFFGDQPFWGRRVFELGVGPRPVPQRRLTAGRLARAIREAVEVWRIRRRAKELGEKIRAEDGVARAVEFIERMLRK